MPEISKRENQLGWACRLLMTVDVIVILTGYLSWYHTKYQLVSPLIPRSTLYEIYSDVGDLRFKISMIASLFFLPGLWLFSFDKKIAAIVFFSLTIVLYLLLPYFL